MILGITGMVIDKSGNRGSAGAGKSTVADRLIDKHGFTAVGFADVMKRFAMNLFDWTPEQLFGSTELKNVPDARYPISCTNCGCRGRSIKSQFCSTECYNGFHANLGFPEYQGRMCLEASDEYLTPRETLQQLGTWGRECYPDIWAQYAMRVAKELLEGGYVYSPEKGLQSEYGHPNSPQFPYKGVCFSDVRFKNELAVIKREGGKVIRVVRPVEELFISNEHESENNLNDVPDEEFDYVIMGRPKDVPDLQLRTDYMLNELNR